MQWIINEFVQLKNFFIEIVNEKYSEKCKSVENEYIDNINSINGINPIPIPRYHWLKYGHYFESIWDPNIFFPFNLQSVS